MKFRSIFTVLVISMSLVNKVAMSVVTYITTAAQFEQEVLQPNVWAAVNFFVPSSLIYQSPLGSIMNQMLNNIDITGWAAQNNIKLFAVNASALPALALKYGYKLPPTLMFFSKGKKTGMVWQIKSIPRLSLLRNAMVTNLSR